jgi:hypothetical protein
VAELSESQAFAGCPTERVVAAEIAQPEVAALSGVAHTPTWWSGTAPAADRRLSRPLR